MKLQTPIIPSKTTFVKTYGAHELDKKAICIFMAIGFFLDGDTYFKDEKVLPAASVNILGEHEKLIKSERWFNWHHSPRKMSFDEALQEFSNLFESIIDEQIADRKVILPLSGGIDSRTQAVALRKLGKQVHSYSYKFQNGFNETKIAQQLAEKCGFEFEGFTIKKGYLWKELDAVSRLNRFQTDLTLPRQMAMAGEFSRMGEIFSLGHWGDVLFDNMGLTTTDEKEQLELLKSKLIKRGGLDLAKDLWFLWQLEGRFEDYFDSRLRDLLEEIDIVNPNAKLRAFKSLYWAPRWTSANLSIFENERPISLPYYDDRMCEFICTVPEEFLMGRRMQLEYIKRSAPDLANITWQDKRPGNIMNYDKSRPFQNMVYKVKNKSERILNEMQGQNYVQRNWELQYYGEENDKQLKKVLFSNGLQGMIPEKRIAHYYDGFKHKPLQYAHSIGMLLVLSKFHQHKLNG